MSRVPEPPALYQLLATTGWIEALARRLVGEDQREDVVQDAWLRVLRSRPRAAGSLRPWLMAVVRSVAVQRARGEARRRAREAQVDPPAATPSTGDLAARAEMQRRLIDRVLELNEPSRSTVLLHFFEGRSAAEIGRAEGVPDSTVRNRLHRALCTLRARLDGEDRDRGAPPGAWRLACVSLGHGARFSPAVPLVLGGVLAMKWQTGVAAVVLIAAVGWSWRWIAQERDAAPVPADLNRDRTLALNAAMAPDGYVASASESGRAAAEPEDRWEVTGRVLAHEDDAPIAGATIELLPPESKDSAPVTLAATTTAADGSFRFRDRANGAMLHVRADGRLPARTRIAEPPPTEVRLLRAATLYGVVRETTGQPLPGARVSVGPALTGIRWHTETTAAPDGSYHLDVPAQLDVRFSIQCDGRMPKYPHLNTGQGGRLDLVLPADGTFVGRAVDAVSDEVVAGAAVLASNVELTRTAPDGTFQVGGIDVPNHLDVRAPGYLMTRRDVDPRRLDGVLDVPLLRAWSVTGTLRTAGGAPVSGATVRIRWPMDDADAFVAVLGDAGRGFRVMADPTSTTTGTDGSFRLEGVTPSTSAQELFLDSPGWARVGEWTVLPRGDRTVHVDLIARAVGSIEVTVNWDGRPAGDGRIAWRGGDASGEGQVSGGKATLRDMPPGEVFLTPYLGTVPAGDEQRVRVAAGEVARVAFDLVVETSTITGRVLSPAGAGLAGAKVHAMGAVRVTTESRDDGAFGLRVPAAESTPFQVFARHDHWTSPLREALPGASDLEFREVPYGTIALRVLDAQTGLPLPRCGVSSGPSAAASITGTAGTKDARDVVPGLDGRIQLAVPLEPQRVFVSAQDLGYRTECIDALHPSLESAAPARTVLLHKGATLSLEWIGDAADLPRGQRCVLFLLDERQRAAIDIRLGGSYQPPDRTTWNSSYSLDWHASAPPLQSSQYLKVEPDAVFTIPGLSPGIWALCLWPDVLEFEPAVIEVSDAHEQRVQVRFRKKPAGGS